MELDNGEDLDDKNRPKNAMIHYHTKLDPKKKPKDTRNSNVYEHISSLPNFAILRKPKSENDIQEFNGGANTNEPSDTNFNTVPNNPVKDNLNEIPSAMWWVPPLKTPSKYMPPSMTVSSRSYSQLSSVARPRVTRSAEDLQKEVISQCNVLEGIRFAKLHKCFETMGKEIDTECQDSNSDESVLVPPLCIPSSSRIPPQHTFLTEIDSSNRSSNQSEIYSVCPEDSSAIGKPVGVVEEFKNHTFKETPSCAFISLNGLVNLKWEKPSTSQGRCPISSMGNIAPRHVVQECNSETSSKSTSYKRIVSTNPNFEEPSSSLAGDSILSMGYIAPAHVDQECDSDASSDSTSYRKIISPQLAFEKPSSSKDIDPFISVDDLANKHIIGPMTQKLAQLCTIQGNLYMDVLNDLKKSHEDFKRACKQRGLLK